MTARRLWLGSMVAAAATLFTAAPATAQLGIGAGLSFSDLDDIDAGSSSATLDASTGYHVGVFANLGSGQLSLRPGVYYHRIGSYDFPPGEELDLSAIEVPLDVRLTLVPAGLARLYVLAGPVLTFPRSGDAESAVEDMSLSADLGAGVDFRLPGLPFSLSPELRYSFGVTHYLSDEIQLGNVTVTPDDGERRVGKFMVRLNVMF